MMSRATVTRNEQVSTWPHGLVAVQFTVVVPRMNGAPEGGLHVTVGRWGQFPPEVAGVG
jgi:hypothetical protein